MFLGRVPVRGEPYWLDEDRAAAVAWSEWTHDLHSCGQPLSETTALKLDEQGRRVAAHSYEAESWYCAGCVAVAAERERMSEAPNPESVVYAVNRLD